MNLNKMRALVYRDLLIIRRSKFRLVEIFYFPLTTIIIWGLFAVNARSFAVEAGLIVLIVNIFWNYALIAQSTVNMQLMEDSWSGSLKQLLLSGISSTDYVIARLITSTIVSSLVLTLLLGISMGFGWVPSSQLALILQLAILTLIVSLAMAVFVTALILVLGRSYGFLSWTALQLFVLLSAPFFPRSIFPPGISHLSYVMPYTHIFEAARNVSAGSEVTWLPAIVIAIAYFILVWPLYVYMFSLARKKGTLARLG